MDADNACGTGAWSDASFFCTAGELGPAPTLLSISPTLALPGVATEVQIEGSGFIDTPSVRLGDTWLLSVTVVSSTTLAAIVPAGLPAGTYTLALSNGDCQEAELPAAFTVASRFYVYLPLVIRTGE